MTRIEEATISPERVQLRPTDLLEIWIIGLESDEFVQISDGRLRGELPHEACAFGVAAIILARAGADPLTPLCPTPILARAATLLHFSTIDEANDAGASFAEIAAALRQARADVSA